MLQPRIIEAAKKQDDQEIQHKSPTLLSYEIVIDDSFVDVSRTANDTETAADNQNRRKQHDFI